MSRVMACVLVFVVAAGADLAAGAQKSKGPPLKEVQVGDFTIAAPIACSNLTVFPILSKVPKTEDRYITLEEGLKSGKVLVMEVGADAAANPPANPPVQQRPARPQVANRRPARQPVQQQAQQAQQAIQLPQLPDQLPGLEAADVNHLIVVNRSDKPLYLMPGEIIYGGQQDRCVGQEYIIPPDGKPVKIEVYCVEHGRWAYRDDAETRSALSQLQSPGQALDESARQKLTEEAKKGKFIAQAGNLNKAGRIAVQEGKGQGEVWNQVGVANSYSGNSAVSGAFTGNYTNPEILKQLEAYVKELEKPVTAQRQVVGAMVAVNGKLESVDVFGSTPLFQKVWPKLLKSHALDAAAARPRKGAKAAKPATLQDAEKFFRVAMQADVQKTTDGKSGLVVTKRETKEIVSYSAAEKRSAAAPAQGMGGMGGFGGSVHSSGYAK